MPAREEIETFSSNVCPISPMCDPSAPMHLLGFSLNLLSL
uniref:Uncharacterized protein n=1 Tax=Setaria italica TaxID=4555 RepID=K3Z1B8_SETIT